MPQSDPKTETRRALFSAYCKRRGWFDEGRQKWAVTEIAQHTLKPVNKVSDLLNGKGSFGSKIARELEAALELQEYALENAEISETATGSQGDDVQPKFDSLSRPSLTEAMEVLGEALLSIDELGRKMAVPVLESLLDQPALAAALGTQLEALVEMRRQPPPGAPSPTSPKGSKKQTTANKNRAAGKSHLTVKLGGGRKQELLELKRSAFDESTATPSEQAWYSSLKSKPKARE